MAEKNPFTPAGTPASQTTPQPVASINAPTPTPAPATGSSAAALAVAHGGNPNGKPRADGLKHGSPEALKADRETARLRKAAQRAKHKSLIQPAPLPPALRPAVAPVPAQGSDAVIETAVEGADFLPWSGEDLSGPLLDTLELLEEADKLSIETKLKKSHVPVENVKEIMGDIAWPARAKKGISTYGGSALAKGLNALGMSSKHKDVALILPSLAYLVTDRMKLHKRLDELIKAANPPTAKP